jgi:hypothetical protein
MGAAKKILARGMADALRKRLPPMTAANVRWVVAAGVLVLFIAAIAVLWKRISPQLAQNSEYRLTEQSLVVTPQPEWIHPKTNIKADVVRDGSLRHVNLLDPKSAVKIADAFKLHAWVKRVVRVQKQAPAQVIVELEYRRPVALVEVVYNNVLSYEPVDAEGTVLPEDLFHHDQKQLENYLRITSDYSMPTGSLGSPWGDDRITGAAHIAALLQTAWHEWKLASIVVQSTDEGLKRAVYEIHTHGNSRIVWGHAPGAESSTESKALQKIMWIAEYVRRQGPFDDVHGAVDVDLRPASGMQVKPRTATRPTPQEQ